jgi:cobalt-zinc-cadmium resistance protein CzcA
MGDQRLSQLGPLPSSDPGDLVVEPDWRGHATGSSARPEASPTKTIRTGSSSAVQGGAGILDVTGWGGKTKTYEITVDLDRLLAHGVTLQQVPALNNRTSMLVARPSIWPRPHCRGGASYLMDQIRELMIKGQWFRCVGDIATVTAGHQPHLGIADQVDDDIVQHGTDAGRESMPTSAASRLKSRKSTTEHLPPSGGSSASTTAAT